MKQGGNRGKMERTIVVEKMEKNVIRQRMM